MQETEFNLLEEPWIRVLRPDGGVEEVSLTDALLKAHTYLDLAGETPTQDVAVLRLLLAVLHTVFSRVNVQGEESPILSPKRARGRWKTLWQLGALPEEPILDYLTQWRERFWLFHPERPFFQVPGMEIGKYYSAEKWNGEILESAHTNRLFSLYAGTEKEELTYAQAVRWLLHMNGFDVTISGAPSAVVKEKFGKLQSTGAGYLGKLGLIMAVGNNLFETLMLNLVLWREGDTSLNKGKHGHPCWEEDKPRIQPSRAIAVPDNAAELLTLQSRRMLLHRENGKVTGLYVLGGDFFPRENAFAEQMTVWRIQANSPKNGKPIQAPKQHDPSVQMWREFPGLVGDKPKDKTQDEARQPGVVRWIAMLRHMKSHGVPLYDRDMTRFRTVSVKYKQKDGVVSDSFSDTLTFHADLLTELGKKWQPHISDEIERCEKVADKLGCLAEKLELAAGGAAGGAAKKARQQFYFAVDMPFRDWLRDIDPQRDGPEDTEEGAKVPAWRAQVKGIARRQAEEMVLQAGPAAYAGRTIKDGKDKTHHYSAPEAYNWFWDWLNRIYKTV